MPTAASGAASLNSVCALLKGVSFISMHLFHALLFVWRTRISIMLFCLFIAPFFMDLWIHIAHIPPCMLLYYFFGCFIYYFALCTASNDLTLEGLIKLFCIVDCKVEICTVWQIFVWGLETEIGTFHLLKIKPYWKHEHKSKCIKCQPRRIWAVLQCSKKHWKRISN